VPSTPEITAAAKVLSRDFEAEHAVALDEWSEKMAMWVGEYGQWHPPLYWEPAPVEPVPLSARDVAKLALEAAEAKRQSQAKFAAIGQFKLPDGGLNHAIIAPFSTELQALRAGEGFTHDSKSGTGEGRFMAVRIYTKARDAWDAVRPAQEDPKEWIRKSIERAAQGITEPPDTGGIYGADYFNAKETW